MDGETKRKGKRETRVDEMAWLKGTRWNWNNWREVVFLEDGSFLAPAENCERQGNPQCTWSTSDDRIIVSYAVHCPPARTSVHSRLVSIKVLLSRPVALAIVPSRPCRFGGAGMHTLTASDDRQTISGARDSDGDGVEATRVS